MKTTHTITLSAFDLLGFLQEKLGIDACVADINMTIKADGVQVNISELKLEWVKDTTPVRDIWSR